MDFSGTIGDDGGSSSDAKLAANIVCVLMTLLHTYSGRCTAVVSAISFYRFYAIYTAGVNEPRTYEYETRAL